MSKTKTAIFIKKGITEEQLKKYGFKKDESGYHWKPSYNCQEYEQQYYKENEYTVDITYAGQIVICPMGWLCLAGKIQTLLFDMFTDGIVEKRTMEWL